MKFLLVPMFAWGAGQLCWPRTIAGGYMKFLLVPMFAGGAGQLCWPRTIAGGCMKFLLVPMFAWGAGQLCWPRTIAGGCMKFLLVPMFAWGAGQLCWPRTIAGGCMKFLLVPMFAWGAGQLCWPRTIAGGFGNPLRVPIIIEERVGVEPTLPLGKPDFESGAFGHSAISPSGKSRNCGLELLSVSAVGSECMPCRLAPGQAWKAQLSPCQARRVAQAMRVDEIAAPARRKHQPLGASPTLEPCAQNRQRAVVHRNGARVVGLRPPTLATLDAAIVPFARPDPGRDDQNSAKPPRLLEAEETFFNRPIVVASDDKHSEKEIRLAALGKTDVDRLLAIVFTVRENLVRVRPAYVAPIRNLLRRDELHRRKVRPIPPWIPGQDSEARNSGVRANVEIRQRGCSLTAATSIPQERLASQKGRLVGQRFPPERAAGNRLLKLLDLLVADRHLCVDESVDRQWRLVRRRFEGLG